jgi:hypothetical protein
MRWYILRTLLYKELLRHVANRGGIALALLLVVAALLLSFFGQRDGQPGSLMGGVQRCYVDYWDDGPWIDHLRQSLPVDWRQQIKFRPVGQVPAVGGYLVYPPGTGAIQIRPNGQDERGPCYKVCFWHPDANGSELAPYEAWFWKESHHYFQTQAASALANLDPAKRAATHFPHIDEERSQLRGGLDSRSALATSLVLFALFFVCVYLLPSLTCEERERGVLLAQALSPASLNEVLAAKCLFYPGLGVGLAALLAGISNPAVLSRPFFWLALSIAAVGSFGIGLAIASLARTQRTASMGALGYTLMVALLLFICQHNNILGVPYLVLEYHCPRMIHAAMSDTVWWYHCGNLAGAATLAVAWMTLATGLFRRYGWQ